MARLKLDVPASFIFKTEVSIRISDINYGGHMGNDALLSIMHEARLLFLKSMNANELDFFGASLIMSDVAIQYKNDAFYGDVLQIEMTAFDFGMTSFDLFYYITRVADKKVIALAKTNMVTFDYKERKMKDVPETFRTKFV